MNSHSRPIPFIYSLHSTGHNNVAWLNPQVRAEEVLTFDYYRRIVQEAEAALFDAVLVADVVAPRPESDQKLATVPFEPLTLVSFLAAATTNLHFIPTASTTFSEPYALARQLATIDHLSAGRLGINLVTSAGDAIARAFGREHILSHQERYDRADEFVEALRRLLTSWEQDAVVDDKARGVLVDLDRIRDVEFHGSHVSVNSSLDVPQSPQGIPPIIQAGNSEAGIAHAAHSADALYVRSSDLEAGIALREQVLRMSTARHGNGAAPLLLPGFVVYAGETRDDAVDYHRELERRRIRGEWDPSSLEGFLGVSLTQFAPDAPVPAEIFPDPDTYSGSVTTLQELRYLTERDRLSLRELNDLLFSDTVPGMTRLIGSGDEIAEEFGRWRAAGAADGFVILFGDTRDGLGRFIRHVVPKLQERGYYRSEAIPGETFRSRLGLADAVV